MKKTYIIPEALIVELGTCKMMAESTPDVSVGGGSVDAGSVDVKENKDVNVWDEEW